MLTASTVATFAESRLLSALLVNARFRANLVWRENLLFDSRFNVPHDSVRGRATLYLVHQGEVQVNDAVHAAPVAMVAAEREFERYEAGAPYVRSWGDPCVALDLQMRTEDLCVPVGLAHGPIAVSSDTWSAVSALAEALAVGSQLAPPMEVVLRSLTFAGVVAPIRAEDHPPPPPSLERLWAALLPFYARLEMSLELADVAEHAAMSSRQLSRDTRLLFQYLGIESVRFREVALVFRLRVAALLLSSRLGTIREVAERVGYQSVDALGRAFRDAGLPPAHELRELVMSPT